MTKQVEITNRDGHILRGIVNIPEDGTRFPAIVNVHGFTGNKSGYKSIYTHTARFLAEHGFASVRFDLYGNGESDGEFEDMTFTGILHDIEDIINWTKTQDFANPDKIILSGQSMGGYAAATAAPIVNPYALMLMCPGAGMWFGLVRLSVIVSRIPSIFNFGLICRRTFCTVCKSCSRPFADRYCACTGIKVVSAAASALTVSIPREGVQSSRMKS